LSGSRTKAPGSAGGYLQFVETLKAHDVREQSAEGIAEAFKDARIGCGNEARFALLKSRMKSQKLYLTVKSDPFIMLATGILIAAIKLSPRTFGCALRQSLRQV
jgi:hypothetical protein